MTFPVHAADPADPAGRRRPAARPRLTVPVRRGRELAGTLASLMGVAGLLLAAPAAGAAGGSPVSGAAARSPGSAAPALRAACPAVPAGRARCYVLYRPRRTGESVIGSLAARPSGLTPTQIETAYRLPVSRSSSQTVAVSIAFHTPHLARYLAVYRRYFGLPACTAASGCFRQLNQQGKASPLPPSGANSGWDLEATLDVSMISVACPHCRILVVEANDNLLANLAQTDRTAARLGAQVISNSYGSRENGFAQAYRRAYRQPGHVVVVSSGDFGFTAASFPANLASVTAVGGTELHQAAGRRGYVENAWAFGSSGCSAYVAKPAWQHDRHCPGRTVADVSAVAANVPIYNKIWGGWVTVAGTSISAPLIAGVYGLAGNAARIRPGQLYAHAGALFDVTRGSNAVTGTPQQACGNDYLCVAKKGYDGPTGLGSPDGTGAF